jgi:chemotaxis protein CheX
MPFDQEIEQLTMSIWDSILKLPIEPDASSPLPAGDRTMSACVHITGAWNGAVALSCGTGLASAAAGIMFGLGQADPATADMQDAMGELVNMIGGNVKALLPGTCQLSLPAVVEGSDYSVRVPGSRVVARVPMRSGTHMLNVSLLEKAA